MDGLRARTPRDGTSGKETPSPTANGPKEMGPVAARAPPSAWDERRSILLLLILYAAQGLPMGLIFGSIPFLLKASASYSDIAVFSLCSMPYALKLLIAPIVDGGRPPLAGLGRRRGWIVPPLAAAGLAMLFLAPFIGRWVDAGAVRLLTPVCFSVIALTAVQDVAVDGWSLELLSPANVAYASTCQSLGTSIGFLSSFTVFLPLNDPSFCERNVWPWVSPGATGAVLSLAGAAKGVGFAFIGAAALVALGPEEKSSPADLAKKKFPSHDFKHTGSLVDQEANEKAPAAAAVGSENILEAYRTLARILKLGTVQSLVIALLFAKFGFSAYDSATSLKLIDFGFPKETLASISLIQAPVRLIGTLFAGRWAAQGSPETPYLVGYAMRTILSLAGPVLVHTFSSMRGVVANWFYAVLVGSSVLYMIAADCLMFVSIGAFFLRITSGSEAVGGSYLTLLYAAQNMGGMWHSSITLAMVERLTTRENCVVSETVKQCPILVDGYYTISFFLFPIAVGIGFHLYRTMRRLGSLPPVVWRAVPV